MDVIVGTHRLLAKDVEFKDLGLLVVDEEQRFGVAHKEAIKKLKQYRGRADALRPRPFPARCTCPWWAFADMSLLQSPPRSAIRCRPTWWNTPTGWCATRFCGSWPGADRCMCCYNRVQTIDVMYARLKKLVPEARIAVGHGQMREHALEDVMLDFYEGKFDVLLCTTIIEAGSGRAPGQHAHRLRRGSLRSGAAVSAARAAWAAATGWPMPI